MPGLLREWLLGLTANATDGTLASMQTVALYEIGPPLRPTIDQDNGFLERFARRPPTAGDRLKFAQWAAFLEAAEAGQNVHFVPHNDLPDALAAYRHFLYGKGADRTFSYERYIASDASGRTTLSNAIVDVRCAVENLALTLAIGAPPTFQFRSGPITCGDDEDPVLSALFPYPATENWQKAIGGHHIWFSGLATLTATIPQRSYSVMLTLHVEDRYNFNPEAEDIATGIPDEANGMFEVTGLAQQYTNHSTLTRTMSWVGATSSPPTVSRLNARRERAPGNNRRARNQF
jgi:hypothetical protein